MAKNNYPAEVPCDYIMFRALILEEALSQTGFKCFLSHEKVTYNNETCNNMMKSEVRSLKSEVWSLKSDVWRLKSEVWSLKSEVRSLKSEVRSLKSLLGHGSLCLLGCFCCHFNARLAVFFSLKSIYACLLFVSDAMLVFRRNLQK